MLGDRCYRYLAKPNKYEQAYDKFYPMGKECPNFWDAKEYLKSRLRTVEQVDLEFEHENIF